MPSPPPAAGSETPRRASPEVAPTAAAVTQPPTTPAAIERGADLFVRSGCVACHGSAAEGYVGPQIARTSLSLPSVLAQVRFPDVAKMTPFTRPQLSDEEVAYIYAYLQSLGPP